MKTTIEIDTINRPNGEEFFSVWFFARNEDHGTECAHIGYFDSKLKAEKAGEAVAEAINITRNMIRDAI